MESKIIGILTHFTVNNYGANLQALSTASYLKNKGYKVMFINWFGNNNSLYVIEEQKNIHKVFIPSLFECTRPCFSDSDIKNAITENKIHNIIIGSDALLHLKFLFQCFGIMNHKIKYFKRQKYDIFPNPFWLSFFDESLNLKIAYMSVSAQGSIYHLFSKKTLSEMSKKLSNSSYISVRDTWTKKMILHIDNKLDPVITPDPVFGLNYNYPQNTTREEILNKFHIPSNYILVSFYASPSKDWLIELKNEAAKKSLTCVALPMPQGNTIDCFDYQIKLPLHPLDWYNLIRYSNGYIGNNMHPIVVSIHNTVPFFSIDNHGLKIFKLFRNDYASKTYDLLSKANLLEYWMPAKKLKKTVPSTIIQKILQFDKTQCFKFAEKQLFDYKEMMNTILNRLRDNSTNT